MKGAKGGNRDRIISWLFSEKNRKKREEELEIEKSEELKLEEKRKERRKGTDTKEETVIEVSDTSIKSEDTEVISVTTTHYPETIERNEDKNKDYKTNKDNDVVIKTIEVSEEKESPTLYIDVEVVEEIKDYNKKKKDKKKEKTIEVAEVTDDATNNFFPEVEEISIHDDLVVNTIEKPELITVSIIEEIEKLLKNDSYDLKDIKYRIEVLSQQEQDEFLLENVEKIQKELEQLIRRFDEIKKKYEYIYSNISIKDLEMISEFDIENIIGNYISDGKDGIDSTNTINQIKEIEEFIEIINNIIEIEKQKDLVQESIDHKLVDFNIRDEEFIKLQDQYADVEKINDKISAYYMNIDAVLNDLNNKINNSVDITRSIETTVNIVPDINRIMQATLLLASSELIPPTPTGQLFKATLFISAAHMMATAFTPREERREVVRANVTDYSKSISYNQDSLKNVLNDISNAFSEIGYMKDLFEKEFSEYRSQIPEYDELIKNIFEIEAELTRQQVITYEYENKLEEAMALNNQKVKVLENE